ncbi:MAG: PepSY domain-containing protein [Proteobacteria bacterium]|nr:PepSY domain-containing protein [Pseudomonadota bacterium]
MLRIYHRWLSLFFAPFLIWVAVTGLVIQYNHVLGTDERKGPSAAELAATHPGFVCPPDLTCRPRTRPGQMDWRMQIKHLHAGQPFGPVGTALSILSGLSLAFFAGSGLWLYIQMWRNRAARALSPRWFWK